MRRASILVCFAMSACLGGKTSSSNDQTGLLGENGEDPQAGQEQPRDDGTQPGDPGPTDPNLPPECAQIQSEIDGCFAQIGPACEASHQALNDCYLALEETCATERDAVNACFEALATDENGMVRPDQEVCQAEMDAYSACASNISYDQCNALAEEAALCTAPCDDLVKRFQEICYPPEPPPPPFQETACDHLHIALDLCIRESFEFAQDPSGMNGEDPAARCRIIEQAIVELCPADQPCGGTQPGEPPREPDQDPNQDPGQDPNSGT